MGTLFNGVSGLRKVRSPVAWNYRHLMVYIYTSFKHLGIFPASSGDALV